MSKEQQLKRADKNQAQRPSPIPEAAVAELSSAQTGLDNLAQLNRLPTVPTSRPIRQATILRMQQQQGNAHVQRFLAHNGRSERADSQGQVAWSGDTRLQSSQQQPMIARAEWGTLQHTLQRDPDDNAAGGRFQLRSPQLTLPRSQGPSLGVGQLQLDPNLFQQLPLQDTISPGLLLRPSPELIQELVDNWLMRYRLTHPGPAPAENEWQQLWSAWRRLAEQWLARGEDAPLNIQLAQEMLREPAAQAVLNLQPGGESVSLSDVAGRVWPAFREALEATQFYPRLKQRGVEMLQQHWPILIPAVGTALGVSLGMGLQGNDWRVMQQLSSCLPMLTQNLQLNDHWTLRLGFAESQPIQGSGEQGVVIGANPLIGFTYRNADIQFSLEGSTNIRFQTGQDSTQGFQVQASPSVQAIIRW